MRYNLCFILLIAALKVSAQKNQEIFYADPSIYVSEGKYYMTGTGGNMPGHPGFSVLESTDMKHWSPPAGVMDSVHMILSKGNKAFGTDGFWAPQILKEDGFFYLAYTANEQISIAQSKNILGPYTQNEVSPIDISEKNIDPFLFRDDDGKYYLYHVRFGDGNFLWVAEFDLQKGVIIKNTLKKCFGQTEPWEATPAYRSAPIMEGPTVIKLKNKYYLFYSANHFRSIDYAVGYAVADSPYGPWVKQKDSPVLHRSVTGENGSGHGDLFQGLDFNLYYVYHVHFSRNQISPRRTRIVPMLKEWDPVGGIYKFNADKEKIIIPEITY